MSDKPIVQERRTHPAASGLSDKEEILHLIEDVDGDPFIAEVLKQKFLQFAAAEASKFSVLSRLYENEQRDKLTGLLPIDDLRWKTIERFMLELRPSIFALVYFDARSFKLINDNLGHEVGDKVIVHIAKVLSAEMREQDAKVRLGGDEFGGGIFLDVDDQQPSDAQDNFILSIVERCCVRFEQTSFSQEIEEWKAVVTRKPEFAALKPTLNPGVIIVHAGRGPRMRPESEKDAFQQLLNMADKMMYKSKRYEKIYGKRRIFYRIVGFEKFALKVLAHKFYLPSAP